jgi:hypothetical protein
LQICYYLYPVVSMAIFQIFTWTTIDDKSDDDIGRQYYNQDNSYLLVGRFWTQHFDTRYFEGTHRTLALALGVPGMTPCCGAQALSVLSHQDSISTSRLGAKASSVRQRSHESAIRRPCSPPIA